ncbi:hypothetical protein DRH13_02535 [Candidatus Woesebacteria bacterium]|nr:MAG: hypothetical protein DRH13_02535 [Candidatus Woesebacteria bacterium]
MFYVEGKPLKGTIIDLETIGSIRNKFKDTRRYEKVKPYIFGYLTGDTIVQKYVEKPDYIPELVQWIKKAILTNLFQEPLYAFFTEFEIGVIYCATGIKVNFDRELKKGVGSKESIVKQIGISAYEDPFPGAGVKCIEEFKRGNLEDCLKHNRACLLKERDLLFKRGFVDPNKIEFHDFANL